MIAARPEIEVLLYSSRSQLDSQSAEKIHSLVKRGLDWDVLISAAHSHGVLSLLFCSLRKLCREAVPPARLELLALFYEEINRRNELLLKELISILSAFRTQGLRGLPFKGPTLASSIYGHIALRQFDDLDIFVPKNDIACAADVLISQGYKPRTELSGGRPSFDFTPDKDNPLTPKYHTFFHQERNIAVDLQWRMAEPLFSFSLDSEDILDRVETVALGNTRSLTFCPEALLVILCAHGSKHLWTRLNWVCDVARTVEAIDRRGRSSISQLVSAGHHRRMVRLGLLLAHDLLKVSLPGEVLDVIRSDRSVVSLARRIQHRLISGTGERFGTREKFFFYAKIKDSWGDRFDYCCACASQYLSEIFSPTTIERELFPLPDNLRFLHYALRPVRLAAKYGLRPLLRSR
jgi:hypothetical protein